MAIYPVYSKDGADRRFADKAALNALTGAQIAQGAEIGTLKEQVRAQAVLSNMLPRQGGPGTPAAMVVGFIGDSWCTARAGGEGGAPEEATMVAVAARRLGVGAAVSGQGSTGWVQAPNAGTAPFSAPARVDAVLDAHPSLLVVVGSVNDNWTIDQNPTDGEKAITDSVVALVTRVRTRAPACPIVVVGPQPTSEYRTYAGSSHKSARAVKAGVVKAGGEGNGIHFVDWLGVASAPAVKWDPASSPNRHWGRGEIICYDGVNYEVVVDGWVPSVNPAAADPYLASFLPSAPVSRRTAVLSGRGAVGKTPASGTRALWLMNDETHVNVGGAQAFGVELADRVIEGVSALREWVIAKGPVVVGPAPATPPPPGPGPARPMGRAADIRESRWGVKWGPLSKDSIDAVLNAAGAGAGVALPVRMSKDEGEDRFVCSVSSTVDATGAGGASLRINQSTIAQLKGVTGVNGVVATLGEALASLGADRGPLVVECYDTTGDTDAEYWVYDQKMMQFLVGRLGSGAAKRVVVATRPALNASRAKAKADAALKGLTRLVSNDGAWANAAAVTAVKDADAISVRPADAAKPEILAAVKNHPERPALWGAGVSTAAEVRAIRAAASAAGLTIEGWLAEGAGAGAEIAAKTQPEKP